MNTLDALRHALQPPVKTTGNTIEFARLRQAAYRELFEGDPLRVFPHEIFESPGCGGAIDVHLYRMPDEPLAAVAISSGMSDYRMLLEGEGPIRREIIQYLRTPGANDMARLHAMAWVPLAQGFALDCFHTVGPLAGEWPGGLFLPPPVFAHESFGLELDGDPVELLWYIPLRDEELEFAREHGVESLMDKMDSRDLPWVFDPADRPHLLAPGGRPVM